MKGIGSSPRLSLCMIVKNEEQWLARCLSSVKGVVDEIVIVDTGSQDGTVAIARSHKALILHQEWRSDFALARNVSLDHAGGEWILVLDADEELERGARATIKRLIASTRADGLQLRQRSVMPPGELQQFDDLHITRLFRNRPEYRYEHPIHEQILPAIERSGGKVIATDLTLLHHGYAQPTVQGQQPRALRNLKLLESALETCPNDPYLHFQIGVTYKALGDLSRAYASLRHALELDSSYLGDETMDRLYMKLAQMELAREDYTQALQYSQSSMAHNPNNVVSLYVAALAHMFRGNVEEAYPCFLRIHRHPNANLSNAQELETVLDYCRTALGGKAARAEAR